jgi:hypothetical protein
MRTQSSSIALKVMGSESPFRWWCWGPGAFALAIGVVSRVGVDVLVSVASHLAACPTGP